MANKRPIGLLDSGLGGLTVAKELHSILPNEDIVYFGDSKNCPYGNRPKDDILALTNKMLAFLGSKNVKMVLSACNSISALYDEYCSFYPFPIVSIIPPMAKAVSDMQIDSVGLIATKFTVESGRYEAELKRLRPDIRVFGQGSEHLARYVDAGNLESPEIADEVSFLVKKFQGLEVKHIILGCTHYPIVENVFKKAAPMFEYLNPALPQAQEAKRILQKEELLNPNDKKGKCAIYTTGQIEVCQNMLDILGCADFMVEELVI